MEQNNELIVSRDMERYAKTKIIEGDHPYERRVYISEVKFLLRRTAEDIIEIGKRLIVIREHEGYEEFLKIIVNEIGLSRTSAYRFMYVAKKVEKFPKIVSSQFGTSHIYALIEANEEDLQELQDKGVFAGRSADELANMSYKELKALVKRLQKDAEKVIGKQIGKLEEKIDNLSHENKRLRARLSEGTPKSIATAFTTAEKLMAEALDIISALQLRDRLNGDMELRKKLLARARKLKKQMDIVHDTLLEELS